jgi:transcriptional regulator with XRE-family HTH domain
MHIGERIKRQRLRRGYTQTELAERSGVKQSLISRLEGGTRDNPSADVLRRLARIIHQPKKTDWGRYFVVQDDSQNSRIQERHNPKTSVSGCPGTVPRGLMVVIGHDASSQPPQADSKRFAPEPSVRSTELPRAC